MEKNKDNISQLTYSIASDGKIYIDFELEDWSDTTIEYLASLITSIPKTSTQSDVLSMVKDLFVSSGRQKELTKFVSVLAAKIQKESLGSLSKSKTSKKRKKIKKKIGWQKYEDLLRSQLESPLLDILREKFSGNIDNNEIIDTLENEDPEHGGMSNGLYLPMNDTMLDTLSVAQNFECWIGHTNFPITPEIHDILKEADGVDVLTIYGRYRFFIGIAKMFEFADVRRSIEDDILNQEEV